MHITRVYADADGESHFEDLDIPLQPGGPIGALSALQPVTGIIFRETAPDYDYSWHNAPRRQYIISLDGVFEITASDGTTRRFGPGTILLVEDTTGRGHLTRSVDGTTRRSVFVTLD